MLSPSVYCCASIVVDDRHISVESGVTSLAICALGRLLDLFLRRYSLETVLQTYVTLGIHGRSSRDCRFGEGILYVPPLGLKPFLEEQQFAGPL